jgi:hypothetical protein
MKAIKFLLITITLCFLSTSPPTSASEGGAVFMSSFSAATDFCSRYDVDCSSIEFWVHPVQGAGYMVVYSLLDCDRQGKTGSGCCPRPNGECEN